MEKTIEWKAPARPYMQRPSYYARFLVVFGFVLSCIFLLLRDYIPILGVWVVVFVLYARTRTKPDVVTHKITRFGVYWYGDIVPFQNIHAFSFVSDMGFNTLRIYNETNGIVYLSLVLPEEEVVQKHIRKFLEKRVPFLDNPPKNDTERLTGWLYRLFRF